MSLTRSRTLQSEQRPGAEQRCWVLACYGVVRDGRLGHSAGRPNGSAGLLGCPEAAGLQSQGRTNCQPVSHGGWRQWSCLEQIRRVRGGGGGSFPSFHESSCQTVRRRGKRANNNESRAWQVGNNVLDPQEAVSVARRQMMQHSRGVLASARK